MYGTRRNYNNRHRAVPGGSAKDAKPVEIGTAMLAILSMRAEFYHVPKGEPEEKQKKGGKKGKNH